MDLPNSQKKLAITVSADECNTAYETIISKLARTADVPGFRKGKAPPQMVLNHFGKKSITAQACEQIIGSAVPAALQQKNIRVRARRARSCAPVTPCRRSGKHRWRTMRRSER